MERQFRERAYSTIWNVLYFPKSPINFLSVTKFANQLDDDEGTGSVGTGGAAAAPFLPLSFAAAAAA